MKLKVWNKKEKKKPVIEFRLQERCDRIMIQARLKNPERDMKEWEDIFFIKESQSEFGGMYIAMERLFRNNCGMELLSYFKTGIKDKIVVRRG